MLDCFTVEFSKVGLLNTHMHESLSNRPSNSFMTSDKLLHEGSLVIVMVNLSNLRRISQRASQDKKVVLVSIM